MPSQMLFWDVDTQADFIYPDGKLYVPGAESIVLNLDRLTARAARNSVLIIAKTRKDSCHPAAECAGSS